MQLDRADAVNAGQVVEPARAFLRHFDERPIGENDIGWLLLRRRDRASQGFERREQFRVGVVRRGRRARPPARSPIDDVLAQGERGLAAQHAPSLFGQGQPVAVVPVALDQSAGLQLSEDAAPVGGRPVLADAEGLELVVSVALNRLGRLAGKNVRQMAEKEPARGAQDRRQRLLRVDPPVDQPDGALADIAMPAWA